MAQGSSPPSTPDPPGPPSMLTSPLHRNALAGIVGKLWSSGLVLATVPLYIRILGVEAYGLIGLFTALQSVFLLLDLGLSTAANRELARLSGQGGADHRLRDLVRSLEVVYWTIAGLIAGCALLLSPVAADRWQHSASLPPGAVSAAALAMGFALALQFPFTLYSAALLGLQSQVLLNVLLVATTTVRSVGALCVLWWIAPTIEAFFTWQILASLLQTALSAALLWRRLPRLPIAPRFSRAQLLRRWRFAAGVSGISALALVLTQADKLILSQLLPLEAFGYYSLAATASGALYVVASPVFLALLPQFSLLAAKGDETALARLYHEGSQLLSVTMLPLAVVGTLFAPEALLLWTGDPGIAGNAHLILSFLLIGTAMNGILNVPYALQLASGWTKLALYQNLVAVLLLLPLLWWATLRFEGMGAAGVWILLNGGCLLISIQFMHRRLLPLEKRHWYCQDLGLPLVGALSIAMAARAGFPGGFLPWEVMGYLLMTLMLSTLAAALLAPYTRGWLGVFVRRWCQ
jgi:O-antigen/teichoic acid export membrane protein